MYVQYKFLICADQLKEVFKNSVEKDRDKNFTCRLHTVKGKLIYVHIHTLFNRNRSAVRGEIFCKLSTFGGTFALQIYHNYDMSFSL